ncbi:MAG: hypothetical protein ACM3UP_00605 [Methanocella sp.]
MLEGTSQTDPVASSATDVVMDEVQAFKAALAALNSIVAQAPEHLEAMFSEVAQGLEAGLKDAESEIVSRAKDQLMKSLDPATKAIVDKLLAGENPLDLLKDELMKSLDPATKAIVDKLLAGEDPLDLLKDELLKSLDPATKAIVDKLLNGENPLDLLKDELLKSLDPAIKSIVDKLLAGENPLDLLKDQLTQSWDPQAKGILDTLLNGGNPLDLITQQLPQMLNGLQSNIAPQLGGMWDGIAQLATGFTGQLQSTIQNLVGGLQANLGDFLSNSLFGNILGPALGGIFQLLGSFLGFSPSGGGSAGTGGYSGGTPVSQIGSLSIDSRTMSTATSVRSQPLLSSSRPQEVKATTVVVFDRQQLAAMRTGKNEVLNYVMADLKSNGPIRQAVKRMV